MKHVPQLFRLALAAVLLTAATPARADGSATAQYDITRAQTMDLTYDVYAGGFKTLAAALRMELKPAQYDMTLDARTQGALGHLFPWSGNYHTKGKPVAKTPRPAAHTARSAWDRDEQVTEMSFNAQGTLQKITTHEDGRTTTKSEFDPALTTGAADLLTAALMIFQNTGHSGKCDGSFPVFDGKRRFNIVLSDAGEDAIKPNRYSVYNGPALRCTVKVVPVGGFRKKDARRGWMAVQAHTEARKKPPTLWLARLEENGPVVPVRMEIASDYGSVIAHLTRAENK